MFGKWGIWNRARDNERAGLYLQLRCGEPFYSLLVGLLNFANTVVGKCSKALGLECGAEERQRLR